DEPVIPGGQKVLVHVRMRLFEFVEQNDRVGSIAQARSQFSIASRPNITSRGAEQGRRGKRTARKLRHVEVQKLSPNGVGKDLAQIGLAGARWPGKQTHADRLAAVLKRQPPTNLRRQFAADTVLANNTALESLRQSPGVDEHRIDFLGHSPLKFLAISQTIENIHEQLPLGKPRRQEIGAP